MDNKMLLQLALSLIEDTFAKGASNEWKDKEFKELNAAIFQKTKVNVSTNTLRRLYGKLKTYKSEYNPQRDTLNALAAFLDYKHWEDFAEKVDQNPNAFETKIDVIQKGSKEPKKGKVPLYLSLSIALIIIIVAAFVLEHFLEKAHIASIQVENQVGNSPSTVVFNYSLEKSSVNYYYIDFDDGDGFIPMPKDKSVITHTYGKPGLYKVKIGSKKGLHLEYPVIVTTRGWEYLIGLDLKKIELNNSTPVDSSFYQDNYLHLSLSTLLDRHKALKPDYKYYLIYQKIDTFRLDGDNFIFETRLNNKASNGGIHCYNTKLIIGSMSGEIKIEMVGDGCFQWASITLSEKEMPGTHHNHKNLAIDLSRDRVIRIVNEQKETSFYIDDELIYKGNYTVSLGEIIKTAIMFRGSGSIDYVKFYTPGGKLVYNNDF